MQVFFTSLKCILHMEWLMFSNLQCGYSRVLFSRAPRKGWNTFASEQLPHCNTSLEEKIHENMYTPPSVLRTLKAVHNSLKISRTKTHTKRTLKDIHTRDLCNSKRGCGDWEEPCVRACLPPDLPHSRAKMVFYYCHNKDKSQGEGPPSNISFPVA